MRTLFDHRTSCLHTTSSTNMYGTPHKGLLPRYWVGRDEGEGLPLTYSSYLMHSRLEQIANIPHSVAFPKAILSLIALYLYLSNRNTFPPTHISGVVNVWFSHLPTKILHSYKCRVYCLAISEQKARIIDFSQRLKSPSFTNSRLVPSSI